MVKVIVLPMVAEAGHLVWRVWGANRPGVYFQPYLFSPAHFRLLHAYVSVV